MKKILPVIFIFFSAITAAQSKDYLLSLDGIGSLKLGMNLTELEKLLHTKITLKVIGVDSVMLFETIHAKYKSIDVELDLIKRQGIPSDEIVVNGISTSSPLCKTKSGLGIGATKLELIAAYEGYYIDVKPDYTYNGDKPEKSETKSSVTIKEDEEGYALIFNLLNNKVISFQIIPMYDDEE